MEFGLRRENGGEFGIFSSFQLSALSSKEHTHIGQQSGVST